MENRLFEEVPSFFFFLFLFFLIIILFCCFFGLVFFWFFGLFFFLKKLNEFRFLETETNMTRSDEKQSQEDQVLTRVITTCKENINVKWVEQCVKNVKLSWENNLTLISKFIITQCSHFLGKHITIYHVKSVMLNQLFSDA